MFETLAKLDEYPSWWREVRNTKPIDEQTCELEIRSSLPYSLFMTAHHSQKDAATGVLEARLSGDLVGHSRWTMAATAAGTALTFSEEVEVHRPLLRKLSFARPAFRANHTLMMRSGERGLRRHLASLNAG